MLLPALVFTKANIWNCSTRAWGSTPASPSKVPLSMKLKERAGRHRLI